MARQQARDDSRIEEAFHFLAEDHGKGVFPGEALDLLRRGRRRQQTDHDIYGTADAEYPPGLHHEGNSQAMSDDLFSTEDRQFEHERHSPKKNAGNQCTIEASLVPRRQNTPNRKTVVIGGAKSAAITLIQTARIDLTLQVGTTTSAVNISAQATRIETSTAELGNVVGTPRVNNLPLNGRNFTQLLLLSPGASPANPSGNASGFPSKPIGDFVFPAVNGQSNRSNMFLLDGINNYGAIRDTYAVQPTIDDVLEFKVQSHNDEAQFGQLMGGIVNLVTKSGTNSFHGSAWEFLCNDAKAYYVVVAATAISITCC